MSRFWGYLMIKLNRISYEVASRPLFQHLSFTFGSDKYGLVGPNGVGKTTLARLIQGELALSEGSIERSVRIGLFRQSEASSSGTVAEYLEGLWDVPDIQKLSMEMLGKIPFDRKVSVLSGGEWVRLRLIRLWIENPQFVILDEPSNNLDEDGRRTVLEFIEKFPGGMILISHDRELLEKMNTILELSNQGLSVYGGSFQLYWEQRSKERQTQEENLEKLKREAQRRHEGSQEKVAKQEKRIREGKRRAPDLGVSRLLLGAMKRKAQVSLNKIKVREEKFVEKAEQETNDSWNKMKMDPFIRFDFEASKPPNGKVHFHAASLNIRNLWPEPLSFFVRGSERWWIRGRNGSGKTSLIQVMMGQLKESNKVAYLDQKYGQLNPDQSLLNNILENSRFSEVELRNELAFFGFYGDAVHLKVRLLSGGELLKASLAKAFLSQSLPEIVILDEPTNNLDLNSQDLLAKALKEFKGAIVLVCHDANLVKMLEVENELNLDFEQKKR